MGTDMTDEELEAQFMAEQDAMNIAVSGIIDDFVDIINENCTSELVACLTLGKVVGNIINSMDRQSSPMTREEMLDAVDKISRDTLNMADNQKLN